MELYVSAEANALTGDGTRAHPFQTIGEAAKRVSPGDTVVVAPGVYREWVNPPHGAPFSRITFRSEIPGGAIITANETIAHWDAAGNAYRAVIADAALYGDVKDLYADGSRLHRVSAEVFDSCTAGRYPLDVPAEAEGVWYAKESDGVIRLYVTMEEKNPEGCEMEAVFRPYSFFADSPHADHITVSGFVLHGTAGCASGSGWVFEDCEIAYTQGDGILFHDSLNSAHRISRCHIHDCKGNGVKVSGTAEHFTAESCHIHHVPCGLFLERPKEAVIVQNRFDHCQIGCRLSQGAGAVLFAKNLLHDNGLSDSGDADLFPDALSGPVTVYANIFLSPVGIRLQARGILFANNLFGGRISPVQGDAGAEVFFVRNLYCNHGTEQVPEETAAVFPPEGGGVLLTETEDGETVLESGIWESMPAHVPSVSVFSLKHHLSGQAVSFAAQAWIPVLSADYLGVRDISARYTGPFIRPQTRMKVYDHTRTGESAITEASGETLRETRAKSLSCTYALLNCDCAEAVFIRGSIAWIRTEKDGTLKEADCAYGIAKSIARWTMEADETIEASGQEAYQMLAEAALTLYESLSGTGRNLTEKRERLMREGEKLLIPHGISMRLTGNYLKFVGESTRTFLTIEEVIRAIHRRLVDYVAEVL